LTVVDNILVVAHGNSLRGIVKYLKGISDTDIANLNIPTAMPYVFEFDESLNFVRDYYLGDPEKIKQMQYAVANQGIAKKIN
jgi:2,3-bisphosphoglycerate-dependent phosphoglycerate mutase 1